MIRALVMAIPIFIVAWLAILALVLRAGGDAPAVFVPFPPDTLLSSLAADVAITAASPIAITLQSDTPELVNRIYAAGAWLVLPAGLEACIPRFLQTSNQPSFSSTPE